MKEYAYVPFANLGSMLYDSVNEFRVTLLACGGMIGARALELRRWRRKAGRRQRTSLPWSLAFYWPVYVWGLQAIKSLTYGVLVGDYDGSRRAMWYVLLRGCEVVYVSALSLLYVVLVCAASRWAIARASRAAMPIEMSLPFAVSVAVLNVFFVNSAVLVLIATMKQE